MTKEEEKEYKKEWYLKNKEKLKESGKKWREKNKDYISKYNKKYRAENSEKCIEYSKNYYKENKEELKEKIKEYKKVNKEKFSEYNKQYAIDNKDKLNQNKSKYKLNNPEKVKKAKKDYIERNKEERKKWYNEYRNNKRKTDILFKLKDNIRCLINYAFRDVNLKKQKHTHEILGCTFEEFKKYIEIQFDEWMTWENHGSYTGNYNETWQYDHIIPISNANSYEEILKLNHYTNFRPLCSKKNLEKSNKILI